MFDLSAIEEHLRKASALYAGVPLDYAALFTGPKVQTEFAHVRFGDRPPEEAIAEVLAHVQTIGEAAADDGETVAAVRIKFYRGKQPAGSKTFRTGSAPGEAPSSSLAAGSAYHPDEMKSEFVVVVRELRQLSTGVVTQLAEQGQAGWKFAANLAGQNQVLIVENAKLRAELEVLKRSQVVTEDPLMKAAGGLLEQLPTVFLTLQQLNAEKKTPASEADS